MAHLAVDIFFVMDILYIFSASECAVFIQNIVNGATWRPNDVNTPTFNPQRPNFTVLLFFFLGGWTPQCPSGSNQMQVGLWTHARRCGNCGNDSQPDGGCDGVFIHACVTCVPTTTPHPVWCGVGLCYDTNKSFCASNGLWFCLCWATYIYFPGVLGKTKKKKKMYIVNVFLHMVPLTTSLIA